MLTNKHNNYFKLVETIIKLIANKMSLTLLLAKILKILIIIKKITLRRLSIFISKCNFKNIQIINNSLLLLVLFSTFFNCIAYSEVVEGLGVSHYIHGSNPVAELDRLEKQFDFFKTILWQDDHGLANIKFKKGVFLEVGCGVGAQTNQLLRFLPKETKVIAIDIDLLKISRAKKTHNDERVIYKAMDATNLSEFKDGQFNGAYVSWVLEHLTEDQAIQLLKELKRTVRHGGIILINEAYMDSVKESNCFIPITSKYTEMLVKQQGINRGNANFGEITYITTMLNKAGFYNFIYNKKPLHNLSNETLQKEFINHAIENYQSILPLLISKKMFSVKEFNTLKAELNSCKDLKTYFGQVKIFT